DGTTIDANKDGLSDTAASTPAIGAAAPKSTLSAHTTSTTPVGTTPPDLIPATTIDANKDGLSNAAVSTPAISAAASKSTLIPHTTSITPDGTTPHDSTAANDSTTAIDSVVANTPGGTTDVNEGLSGAAASTSPVDAAASNSGATGVSIATLFDQGDLDAILDRAQFDQKRAAHKASTTNNANTNTNTTTAAAQPPTTNSDKPTVKRSFPLGSKAPARVLKRVKVPVTTTDSGSSRGTGTGAGVGTDTDSDEATDANKGKSKGKGKGKGKAKRKPKAKAPTTSARADTSLPRNKQSQVVGRRLKAKVHTAEGQAAYERRKQRFYEQRQRNAVSMWTTIDPERYIFFWSAAQKFGWLSQWWTVTGFTVGGMQYISAEQYMMYHKAMLFKDKDASNITLAGRIMEETSNRQIKIMGRQVKGLDQEVWDDNRERIVREGNLAKFTASDPLKWALLSTGNKILVEASPSDSI
ncbi:hypothetical protein F5B21DRAFT_521838, partial [Xylaria acuta]